MKSLVRVFVAALVLSGAIATTHATMTTTKPSAKTLGMMSAGPLPSCPPNDPNGCGW
jgi:hypothetical protein